MGLFGLEAFSLSFLSSLVTSLSIMLFGAFEVSPERRADATKAVLEGVITGVRTAGYKITHDPINKDFYKDKIEVPKVDISIPLPFKISNLNDQRDCFADFSDGFRNKCQFKILIENLSINNIGLTPNRKTNVELEVSGVEINLKELIDNQLISEAVLTPLKSLTDDGIILADLKLGLGYKMASDKTTAEVSFKISEAISVSAEIGISNFKVVDGNINFLLEDLKISIIDDGMREFVNLQVNKAIGVPLSSGMFAMLTMGVDDDLKGSLASADNMISIAQFLDGSSREIICSRDMELNFNSSFLQDSGYLDSPISIAGILCEQFSNQ